MFWRNIQLSIGTQFTETQTLLCESTSFHVLSDIGTDCCDSVNVHSFEFDSLVTAPLGGFPTAIAYYRWASASNTIRDIRVPFLGISALDDPIVDSSGIPFEAVEDNNYLTFAVTRHGGHVSSALFALFRKLEFMNVLL